MVPSSTAYLGGPVCAGGNGMSIVEFRASHPLIEPIAEIAPPATGSAPIPHPRCDERPAGSRGLPARHPIETATSRRTTDLSAPDGSATVIMPPGYRNQHGRSRAHRFVAHRRPAGHLPLHASVSMDHSFRPRPSARRGAANRELRADFRTILINPRRPRNPRQPPISLAHPKGRAGDRGVAPTSAGHSSPD